MVEINADGQLKRRKPKGEGSLFQRSDGYWVFQIRHRGRTRTEFLGTRDEKDAQKSAKSVKRRLMGEIAHDEDQPGASPGVLVSEVVGDYIQYAKDHLKSAGIIEQVLRAHFLGSTLAKRKASSITTADLRFYVERRTKEGARPATVKNELPYLRAAFNYAHKEQTPPRVRRVPAFPIPSVANTRSGFLELDHYEALLRELPDSLKLAFVVAYHVGDRKRELLSIDVDQVQLDDGFIVLDPEDTKNGIGRNLPIYGDMEKWLHWQLEIRKTMNLDHNKLFFWHRSDVGLSHGGNRVAPGSPIQDFRASWNASVNRMVESIGARQYTGLLFHDLRSSAVRNMVQKARIPEVQAMMISGHKSTSMLTRYNIVGREDVADAGKRLGAWMKSQRAGKPRR